MNKRFETVLRRKVPRAWKPCKTLACAELTAAFMGKSIWDVLAIEERDEWTYPKLTSVGRNYSSYHAGTCSGFVVHALKKGGVFKQFGLEDADITANEFTPRDIAELEIFDPEPPSYCEKNVRP